MAGIEAFKTPFTTDSAEATQAFGQTLARHLKPGTILCFFGDLAAGKTTLIKGIVQELTGIPKDQVSSPTFTYLHIYPGDINVYHFDLYRLKDEDEFLSMGFEEMLRANGVCCIEWSERIAALLPPDVLRITLTHAGEDRRTIEVS